jgi:uncharacterized membrane protein YgcG
MSFSVNIFETDGDEIAWNMDGSSSDRPTISSSWIREWEIETGHNRGLCRYVGCRNEAQHGGHVWISSYRGVFVAPICQWCNDCENSCRWQGSGSRIKKGTVLLQRPYTEDMRNAPRRMLPFAALRHCQGCQSDISKQPPNHTMCLSCFQGQSGRGSQHFKQQQGRRCRDCCTDISGRPPNHILCYECFIDSSSGSSSSGGSSSSSSSSGSGSSSSSSSSGSSIS